MPSKTQQIVYFFSGEGGLSQSDPETGTLYPASSDGTFIWTLEQPASPKYLTQFRGPFRAQDLSGDGLGTVNNGWEWMLEYQVDGTWTFSWYSVTDGTPSAAIQTQTNIGSVTNVRVILDGNSLEVATSSDGENYTARGSTTSSTYQSEKGISASYTGATGSDLITNGDFVNGSYTGDIPDNWTASEDATHTLAKVAGGLEFTSDSNIFLPRIQQNLSPVSGETYILTRDAISGGLLVAYDQSDGTLTNYSSAEGVVSVRGLVSGTTSFRVYARFGSGVITAVSVEAYKVGALDASGDGGFSEVVQS